VAKMDKSSVIYGANQAQKLKAWNDWNGVTAAIKADVGDKSPHSLSKAKVALQDARDDDKMTADKQAYIKVGVVKKDLVFRVKSKGIKDLEYDGVLLKNYETVKSKLADKGGFGMEVSEPNFTPSDVKATKLSHTWWTSAIKDCTVDVAAFKNVTSELKTWSSKSKANIKKQDEIIKKCGAAQTKLEENPSKAKQKAYAQLVQAALNLLDSVASNAMGIRDASNTAYRQLSKVEGQEAKMLRLSMEAMTKSANEMVAQYGDGSTRRERILVMLKGMDTIGEAGDTETTKGWENVPRAE